MQNSIDDPLLVYTKENETTLIEINLSTIGELFNPLDPSPIHRKDLEEDVENFIVTGVQDFPLETKQKIIIYLPEEDLIQIDQTKINQAINNFFKYRAWSSRSSLKKLFRDARISLLIGTTVLFTAIICKTFLTNLSTETWVLAVAEGLLIAGWVSLWHPIQKFLYDWWPLKRSVRIYEKLQRISLECRNK